MAHSTAHVTKVISLLFLATNTCRSQNAAKEAARSAQQANADIQASVRRIERLDDQLSESESAASASVKNTAASIAALVARVDELEQQLARDSEQRGPAPDTTQEGDNEGADEGDTAASDEQEQGDNEQGSSTHQADTRDAGMWN